jgi:hypothetical protein
MRVVVVTRGRPRWMYGRASRVDTLPSSRRKLDHCMWGSEVENSCLHTEQLRRCYKPELEDQVRAAQDS